jgi:antitoxin PrlF
MIDKHTFLVHLSPDEELEDEDDEDESLMLKLFLDALMKFAIATPDSLTPYTQKMATEMDELLDGVTVGEDT